INVPIHLKVPVNIPLNETQLHDPFQNLQTLFDPFVRLLGNLPSEWNEVLPFVANIISGKAPNLMASNKYIDNPWPGFRTGLGTPSPSNGTTGSNGTGTGPNNNGTGGTDNTGTNGTS